MGVARLKFAPQVLIQIRPGDVNISETSKVIREKFEEFEQRYFSRVVKIGAFVILSVILVVLSFLIFRFDNLQHFTSYLVLSMFIVCVIVCLYILFYPFGDKKSPLFKTKTTNDEEMSKKGEKKVGEAKKPTIRHMTPKMDRTIGPRAKMSYSKCSKGMYRKKEPILDEESNALLRKLRAGSI
ncbi:hypothetical protein ADUPG1_012483 [Aduncisulcus paluster]|uniref:Uncharacterized protein n=1 Tax=Aduncisulcus paluster TaxID=2918883 RepID=A0ABQ5K3U5_9EUKA|nr:hypothetical protein ADUPG1_012483 [Aduncisulcus paluster]